MVKTYISKIDGKWYAYAGDSDKFQVFSIGNDNPNDSGRWYAAWTADGIKYVATPLMTRRGAYEKARRNGEYGGVIKA